MWSFKKNYKILKQKIAESFVKPGYDEYLLTHHEMFKAPFGGLFIGFLFLQMIKTKNGGFMSQQN